jgi:hypothetical protein
MFCGKPGHTSDNCNAKSSRPMNGRFVSASESSTSSPESSDASEVSPTPGKD